MFRAQYHLTLRYSDAIGIWPKQEIILGSRQLQQYAVC